MDMMLEQFKIIFDRPEKVRKLREVILNLAVRGKLVEQDPNDEPASVLLERIREEKERLIKKKKIKKEKPVAEISDEEKSCKLPNGWVLCRLGELVTYKNGYAFSSRHMDVSKKGIPVIKSNTIMQKKVVFNYKTDYVSNLEEKMKDSYVEKGDLLMCLSSQSSNVEPLGVTALYEYEYNSLLNQRVLKMKPLGELVLTNKFLLNSINSQEFHYTLSKKGSGSAQSNLKLEHVMEMIFKLPPLEEQKRIVRKVDSLMLFCDKLEKSLEKKVKYGYLSAKSVFNSIGNVNSIEELEESLRFIITNFRDLTLGDNAVKELKNGIVQLAVQGKLVIQNPDDEPASVLLERIQKEKERLIKEKKIKKEEPLAEITEEDRPYILQNDWKLIRLGEISKIIEYGTSTKADLDESKIPVLRMNNIIDGRLDFNNLKYVDSNIKDLPRLYLKKGDLLFNRTNSYELVGKTAVFSRENDSMTFASYLIRISLFNDFIDAEYINIVMNSNIYRITQIEPQITQQNGQANFNGTKLKSTLIPLPPLVEQKRIVEKVNSLMQLCDELENNIEQSKRTNERLMQSVLQDAFNDNNEENNQLSFGEFIKQKRKEKGITITNMLELLKDVKSSEYTNIEEGFVKPEQFIIEKIANALKLSETEIKYLKKLKIKTDATKCLDSDYEIKIAARRINKN